jgi:hypothetical protein
MTDFIYSLPHQCSEIIIRNIDSFSTLRSLMITLAILDPVKFNELKYMIQLSIFRSNPFIHEIIEINNNIDTIVTRTVYMKYINRLYKIGQSLGHNYNSMSVASIFTKQCSNSSNKKFINITKMIRPLDTFKKENVNGFNINSIVIPFNYIFQS